MTINTDKLFEVSEKDGTFYLVKIVDPKEKKKKSKNLNLKRGFAVYSSGMKRDNL